MPDLSLFGTPVSMRDLSGMDEINRDATRRLVAESLSLASVHRSNVGGWHSQNLAGRPEACFRDLLQRIVTGVRETVEGLAKERQQRLPAMRIGIHAWAMVMRNGDYTIPHDHSDVHWATVYYLDAGDADATAHPASGLLALVDPRHGRPMPGLESVLGTTFTVLPRTGRLVVFPGWLLHYVHTYQGQRPRVSVSCNLVFEPVAPFSADRQVGAVSGTPSERAVSGSSA
ncbi:MAG TPA: putative 2OG-Fe(II) oxygenase [Burkholderiales bacterium]|nr:putative 2OG-Fe(II) oxygenase [Burkholderiales bacterium]